MRSVHLIKILIGLLVSPAILVAQRPQPMPPVLVGAVFTQPDGRWPDSLRFRLRDSLARGRERWQTRRPQEYLIAAISTWGMFRVTRTSEYDGQLEAARVRGDSLVGIVHRPSPQFTPAPDWRTVTVDSVFLHLERAVESPTRQIVALKLDPVWGYPKEWQTDDARNGYSRTYITDQVGGGAIVFFEPVVPSACGLIRRVLRRCIRS